MKRAIIVIPILAIALLLMPANLITSAESPLTVYVSPSGSDTKDGLTHETALKTFHAALLKTPAVIYADRGTYSGDYFTITSYDSLKILPYPDDKGSSQTNAASNNIIIDAGYELKNLAFNETDQLWEQAFVGSNIYKYVFITNSIPYKTTNSNGLTRGGAPMWQVAADPCNDKRVIPVASKALCISTEGSFYWDGTAVGNGTVYIHPWAGAYEKFVTSTYHAAVSFTNMNNLELVDFECRYQYYSNIIMRNITNACLTNVAVEYSNCNEGFTIENVNGNFYNCSAFMNAGDGINLHGSGTTAFYDCNASYSLDDGMSHHNTCIGTVYGGSFTHNGKAGIAPAYGAQVSIYNTVCSNNTMGIGYLTSTENIRIFGTIARNNLESNKTGLVVQSLATVKGLGNVFANNTTNTNVTGSYTTILFGDVSGDSNIDSIDAGILVDLENYFLSWDPFVDSALYTAGDLNSDGNIDSIDSGIIVDAENYLVTIDQTTGLAVPH